MRRDSFNVLFFIKKTKLLKNGEASVCMRTHYKPQMNGERYYTTEEVCQMLKITKRTLQQYRDDGVIPFVALPGKMLYRESDLRAALEKNYVAPFAHRNAEDFPAVYGRR